MPGNPPRVLARTVHPASHARHAASRAHSRTSQQGSTYPRDASTNKASHHSLTTSLPCASPEQRAPSHPTVTRTAGREREEGGSNEEGTLIDSTYVAAVRSHASFGHRPTGTREADRWNRVYIPQNHHSTPLSKSQHRCSDNIQYPYDNIERNRYSNVFSYQTKMIMRERKQGVTIVVSLIMCKETVDLTTNFYVLSVNDLVIRAACVSDTVRRKMAMK